MLVFSPVRRMSVWSATKYFNQFPSYCHMVADAKKLARRSILIDHCGYDFIDLKTGLNNVEQAYTIDKETRRGFTRLSLLEFRTEEDADRVIQGARHNEGLLPIKLKFLLYAGSSGSDPTKQELDFPMSTVRLSSTEEQPTEFESYTELISRSMMSLVDLKLRFMTLVNLEQVMCSGVFDQYELMPFGSSVIDTGTNSGDLDLVITRKEDHYQTLLNSFTHKKRPNPAKSNLFHIDKSLYRDSGFRGTMRYFETLLREYMPLTDNNSIQSIHSAKVPIIRFTSRQTSIDCDLSFDLGMDSRDLLHVTGPRTSIPMTEALYSFCRHSGLFAALVSYLRVFARLTAITSKEPNVGMTNFQLLSLIVAYLQQVTLTKSSQPTSDQPSLAIVRKTGSGQETILPSFKQLISSGFRPPWDPHEISEEQINQLMPSIITDFFRFYTEFDFENKSLNIYEATIERKLDNSIIFVLNPIDTARNICHNVNRKACDHFVLQANRALEIVTRSDGSECPLSFIRNLIKKHRQQLRKSKLIDIVNVNNQIFKPNVVPRQARYNLRKERLAHDLCE